MSVRENPYFKFEEIVREWEKQSYDISRFENRVVRHPWTFLVHDKGVKQVIEDGKIVEKPIVFLEHQEGDVIVEGTNISEKYLGNMDVGIAVLFEFMKWALPEMYQLKMEIKAIKDTQLNGMKAISFYAIFNNLDGIIINDGYYDVENRVVSNG